MENRIDDLLAYEDSVTPARAILLARDYPELWEEYQSTKIPGEDLMHRINTSGEVYGYISYDNKIYDRLSIKTDRRF